MPCNAILTDCYPHIISASAGWDLLRLMVMVMMTTMISKSTLIHFMNLITTQSKSIINCIHTHAIQKIIHLSK